MAEQNNDLAALANLAATVPAERRRALEGQLPFACNPRFDAGLVAGLARASQIVAEQQGEEAARPLQEIAAVAAARVLQEQHAYERLRQETGTAEFRAQLEAEAELIRAGQVTAIPIEDVMREMQAIQKAARSKRPTDE
jgi:hypothetical protein